MRKYLFKQLTTYIVASHIPEYPTQTVSQIIQSRFHNTSQ